MQHVPMWCVPSLFVLVCSCLYVRRQCLHPRSLETLRTAIQALMHKWSSGDGQLNLDEVVLWVIGK